MHICWSQSQTKKTQHSFANSYYGIQGDFAPASGDIAPLGMFRLNIGALHFWKYADFYISIPLVNLGPQEPDYNGGVLTGARFLPLSLGKKTISPFFGVYWCTPSIELTNGPEFQKNSLGMETGFYFAIGKSTTAEVLGRYNFGQSIEYPTPGPENISLTMPDWFFSFSLKRYLDFTAGNSSIAGQKWVAERSEELKSKNKLSVFSVGIGLSANIQLSPFDFISSGLGIPKQGPNRLFPDFGIGYYFYKPDMGVRISYRPMNLSNSGFGTDYSFQQHRLLAEGFKFLFDYNGFAPFLGLGAGADYGNLRLNTEGEKAISKSEWLNSYAIIFGWDIRPSRVDTWYLRTNLRYVLQDSDSAINLGEHHLEVNFIQFVLYPGRL